MAIVRIVAGALSLSIAGALISIVGCSGNSDASVFGGNADAGNEASQPVFDSGSFSSGDASDGNAIACTAIADGAFVPAWKSPAPFAQGKCDDTQIDGFYAACLTAPVDPATCEAFTKANADCAACMQSDDSDSNQGPVVWHLQRTSYTMNVPGCVANAEQKTDATACGPALQAILECAQSECTSCFAQTGDFSKFQGCEQSAVSAGCATFQSKSGAACAEAHADAAAPVTACFKLKTEDTHSLYKRIAPLFCGGGTK